MRKSVIIYYYFDNSSPEFISDKQSYPSLLGTLYTTEKKYFDINGCISDGGDIYEDMRSEIQYIGGEEDCINTFSMYVDEKTMLAHMTKESFNMIRNSKFDALFKPKQQKPL